VGQPQLEQRVDDAPAGCGRLVGEDVAFALQALDRKIAPVALLDLAVEYGADVAKVADEVMTIAERSHIAGPLIAATEQDIGVWFADQAAQAPGHREDQLAALIDAMCDAIGANAAQDILARAGLTGSDATVSRCHPSAR
jgi:hypothetical protein